MPLAPVNDKGGVLYYEDTGIPGDSTDYVTVILLHGVIFHGGERSIMGCLTVSEINPVNNFHGRSDIFKPLSPYARSHDLRFVRINLRDYPHSTPLSQEEIDAILEQRENTNDILLSMGQELAAFLTWFIEMEKTPEMKTVSASGTDPESRPHGGVSVLAWSMGNLVPMALVAHLDKLPANTKALLEKYMRSWILLGRILSPRTASELSLLDVRSSVLCVWRAGMSATRCASPTFARSRFHRFSAEGRIRLMDRRLLRSQAARPRLFVSQLLRLRILARPYIRQHGPNTPHDRAHVPRTASIFV